MENSVKAITVLVENHPNDYFVCVAYLMWEKPLSPDDGLPAFIQTAPFKSPVGAFIALADSFHDHSPLKSFWRYDFSVEHVVVTEYDLVPFKTENNG